MSVSGLKNINMLSKEQYNDIPSPSANELYAISGSGFGFPSNRYENLTLGASGTTYTAPANGWVTLNKSTTSANQYAFGVVNENGLNTYSVTPNSGGYNHIFFPVMKGQTFRIDYTSTGTTNYFRFIYAEGE